MLPEAHSLRRGRRKGVRLKEVRKLTPGDVERPLEGGKDAGKDGASHEEPLGDVAAELSEGISVPGLACLTALERRLEVDSGEGLEVGKEAVPE